MMELQQYKEIKEELLRICKGKTGLSLEHLRLHKLKNWLQHVLGMIHVSVLKWIRITGVVGVCECEHCNSSGIQSAIWILWLRLIEKLLACTNK